MSGVSRDPVGLRASHGVPSEKGMRVDWKWGLSEVQFRMLQGIEGRVGHQIDF